LNIFSTGKKLGVSPVDLSVDITQSLLS